MWLMTRYGFYSASVQGPNTVIRARCKQHLENLIARFKIKAVIIQTDNADYLFRILLSKAKWADIVKKIAEEQDWSNFKDEAERYGKEISKTEEDAAVAELYHDALAKVWCTMYDFQFYVAHPAAREESTVEYD